MNQGPSPSHFLIRASPPQGLEPITELATALANCQDTEETMDVLLRWHAEWRSPWIVRADSRYVLVRRAPYETSDAFHGYTIPSLYSILADLKAAE